MNVIHDASTTPMVIYVNIYIVCTQSHIRGNLKVLQQILVTLIAHITTQFNLNKY